MFIFSYPHRCKRMIVVLTKVSVEQLDGTSWIWPISYYNGTINNTKRTRQKLKKGVVGKGAAKRILSSL